MKHGSEIYTVQATKI